MTGFGQFVQAGLTNRDERYLGSRKEGICGEDQHKDDKTNGHEWS